MKRILLVLFYFSILALGGCGEKIPPLGTFAYVQGVVLIQRQNSSLFQPVKTGDPVYDSETVKTALHSAAGLFFAGGVKVSLGENTQMLAPGFERNETRPTLVKVLHLLTGKLWAKLTHRPEPFEIRTRDGIIAVKGTVFQAETAPAGKTTLTVFEGLVEFGNNAGKVAVPAGRQSSATASSAPQPPVKVDLNKVGIPAGPPEFYLEPQTPTLALSPTPAPKAGFMPTKKTAEKAAPQGSPQKATVEITATPVEGTKNSQKDVLNQLDQVRQNARQHLQNYKESQTPQP